MFVRKCYWQAFGGAKGRIRYENRDQLGRCHGLNNGGWIVGSTHGVVQREGWKPTLPTLFPDRTYPFLLPALIAKRPDEFTSKRGS